MHDLGGRRTVVERELGENAAPQRSSTRSTRGRTRCSTRRWVAGNPSAACTSATAVATSMNRTEAMSRPMSGEASAERSAESSAECSSEVIFERLLWSTSPASRA